MKRVEVVLADALDHGRCAVLFGETSVLPAFSIDSPCTQAVEGHAISAPVTRRFEAAYQVRAHDAATSADAVHDAEPRLRTRISAGRRRIAHMEVLRESWTCSSVGSPDPQGRRDRRWRGRG